MGWTDGAFTTFALVDYAGLASDYLEGQGVDLRTRPECTVRQRELEGGGAEITVGLSTTRALGFAQNIDDILKLGFLGAPTIFGNKAQDVATGATPAVGPAQLKVSFVIAEPGADLPDLLDVVNTCDYVPVQLSFESQTNGTRADGTRAELTVREEASTPADGCSDATHLTYTTEIVEIVPPAR